MAYYLGRQDMTTLDTAQAHSVLLTNGLGGYASVTAACSVNRCDQGILVAAVRAPNERITLVHRLREQLQIGSSTVFLSTQRFSVRTAAEEGYRYLTGFSFDDLPVWHYRIGGITVTRTLCTARERNASCVRYEIENHSETECTIQIDPFLKLAPKEEALREKKALSFHKGTISNGTFRVHLETDGTLRKTPLTYQCLSYPEDAKDGRREKGWCTGCCRITKTIAPGEAGQLTIVFSMEEPAPAADAIIKSRTDHLRELKKRCAFTDPIARQLAVCADDYIVRRDSTDGKTILAGYPLFSDWGRDTMIALPGCCLATGRYDDAKSILRTFLAYEKDGLVPNLFPEGETQPMYNTVDAALLLIDCVCQYVSRTEDLDFAREAWPVMERIIAGYRQGTHHHIGMDSDGLIFAGSGLDQVTWMDVCVNGILPTPRHGKPVEINAYWYNALRIMGTLAGKLRYDGSGYEELARLVKSSFVEKFYIAEKGYLRDVLSGTEADEQLRCNQIWALSMPFTMLSPEQEASVVAAVSRHLYTPCGLRTLSPEDPEFQPCYGGSQLKRDLAYHQGTTWVFPLGGYYLAWLKVHGNTRAAACHIRQQLQALEPMLREGCLGQLPEIYDGEFPAEGKGCFAQAWSVGEMLRVFEAIDQTVKSEAAE